MEKLLELFEVEVLRRSKTPQKINLLTFENYCTANDNNFLFDFENQKLAIFNIDIFPIFEKVKELINSNIEAKNFFFQEKNNVKFFLAEIYEIVETKWFKKENFVRKVELDENWDFMNFVGWLKNNLNNKKKIYLDFFQYKKPRTESFKEEELLIWKWNWNKEAIYKKQIKPIDKPLIVKLLDERKIFFNYVVVNENLFSSQEIVHYKRISNNKTFEEKMQEIKYWYSLLEWCVNGFVNHCLIKIISRNFKFEEFLKFMELSKDKNYWIHFNDFFYETILKETDNPHIKDYVSLKISDRYRMAKLDFKKKRIFR